MELLTCCIGGAQNAFERIEEVDGLAKKSIDIVNNVMEKGNDMRQINDSISPMLKERPNPATLIKVPGLCKDAADLTNGMKDLTTECCEHAAEMSQVSTTFILVHIVHCLLPFEIASQYFFLKLLIILVNLFVNYFTYTRYSFIYT